MERKVRIGSYGVIIQHERILLVLKSSGPYEGLWDLPGGAIEFGESPEEALIREIYEEAALHAGGLKLLTTSSFHRGTFHHIGILFQVKEALSAEGARPEDVIRWERLDQLNESELTPFAKVALKERCMRPM